MEIVYIKVSNVFQDIFSVRLTILCCH